MSENRGADHRHRVRTASCYADAFGVDLGRWACWRYVYADLSGAALGADHGDQPGPGKRGLDGGDQGTVLLLGC